MIETVVVLVIVIAFLLIFKSYIAGIICNVISRFFPNMDVPELTSSTVNKGWLIFFTVLFALFVIGCIVNIVIERKYDKAKKKYKEEQKKVKLAFMEEYSLNNGVFGEVLEQIVGIELLTEPVAENFYRYRNNADSQSQWGVYMGRYFLQCGFTLQTIQLTRLLRENGIEVKRDLNCSFDKE